jgi:hypothetical protein
MSLSETKVTDRIEVLENGSVQVREATRIMRDGEVIAQNFHRFVVSPGQDTTGMDAKVIAICAVAHTPEVLAAYEAQQAQAQLAAQQTPQE